jgi:cell division transport system permease protein
MIVALFRTIRFALQNFSRNLWLSLITVFILVLTTMSITLVAGLSVVGNQLIQSVENRVDTDFYFYDYASEDSILKAQEFLKKQPQVKDVVYVSKEEAFKQFKEEHANDEDISSSLTALDENVLPASVVVRAHRIQDYPIIIQTMERSEFHELIYRTDYTDNRKIIDTITSMTERAYEIGLAVSALFIVISVIVIFNTIRIAIYSHREEIGIMKLVGATNWFIRGPYILESVLIGTGSALITLALFYGLLYLSDPMVSSFFESTFSLLGYFTEHLVECIVFEVVGAVLLSVLSSMVAITRYLRG